MLQKIKNWWKSFIGIEDKKFYEDLQHWLDGKGPYYLTVVGWNVWVRFVGSLVLGLFAGITTLIVLGIAGFNIGLVGILMIAVFVSVFLTEDTDATKAIRVPPTKFVAQLLIFGLVLPVYLRSSTYNWTGERVGFSVSTKPALPFTDKQGFIKTGEVPFVVWDHAEAEKDSKERKFITAPTKNFSEIEAEILLILEVNVKKLRLVLDSDDPARDVGDRARQEWRELVGHFVDTDVPKLHSVLNEVYKGRTLITAFNTDPADGYKEGAMVINSSGEAIFALLEDLLDNAELEKKLQDAKNERDRLRYGSVQIPDDIKRQASEQELQKARTEYNALLAIAVEEAAKAFKKKYQDDGQYKPEQFSGGEKGTLPENLPKPVGVTVHNPIQEALEAVGLRLKRMSIGDIDFVEEVKQAAANKSAETEERIAQGLSTQTIHRNASLLMGGEGKLDLSTPAGQYALSVAAALDNENSNFRSVLVPGGNSSAKAAALIGDGFASKTNENEGGDK